MTSNAWLNDKCSHGELWRECREPHGKEGNWDGHAAYLKELTDRAREKGWDREEIGQPHLKETL